MVRQECLTYIKCNFPYDFWHASKVVDTFGIEFGIEPQRGEDSTAHGSAMGKGNSLLDVGCSNEFIFP
jgi:hypothetical protein